MTRENEFVLKRGLQNIVIAEVLSDTAEAIEYGTVEKLIPAGEMGITVDSEQTPFYFDNVVFATIGREGGSEISITGAGLRATARARLNGKNIDGTTGAVLDSGRPKDVYFALGAESFNTDGTRELFWFAKGTFSIPEESNKTMDESTDAKGTELTYTAIQTTCLFKVDGEMVPHKRTVIDTAVTKVKEEQDFFAVPVTPLNIGTICEKLTA